VERLLIRSVAPISWEFTDVGVMRVLAVVADAELAHGSNGWAAERRSSRTNVDLGLSLPKPHGRIQIRHGIFIWLDRTASYSFSLSWWGSWQLLSAYSSQRARRLGLARACAARAIECQSRG
jgi:hypothetical protein